MGNRARLVWLTAVPAALLTWHGEALAQGPPRARISEEVRILDTYEFSDPNPVPILTTDRRLYPYHSFEGYSATSEPREWKVVTMENDLIEVFVLPEVGGKVWGAVVKTTGHEFIYRNEVMKFRDIALRGPWTSGGIEFNFGVIGHTPATATPVDYTVRENDDGSVSTVVGAMDLPSRTHWRVEIRLPADQASFETRALWYNPTPLEQPYYNWMTAAAFAQDDLELFVPGDAYLEHSGRERAWPSDAEGRFLPLYRNNAFGGNKSYHVVGELNDFFGGYYHDEGYGWGHWARHEDMPGRKMWLWALSRTGGVWEDLLTDTDGQYVEFQAGRLFVQYSPGDHQNPVTQAAFDPVSASRWTETWFPLEGTGGLTEASPEGAMHVAREDDRLRISVHAFGDAVDTIRVWSDDDLVAVEPVTLAALIPVEATFDLDAGTPYRITLSGLGLDHASDPEERRLARPFAVDSGAWRMIPEVDRQVFAARELARARLYAEARDILTGALAEEPWNRDVLLGLGDLSLRSARYEEGLDHVRRALQLDTYDPKANYLAGNLYRALGMRADARDSFGWAARSVAFRTASYVQLAEMMAEVGKWAEVKRYAELARDSDRYSVPALQLLALSARRSGDLASAQQHLAELLEIDPLHHFVVAESYVTDPTPDRAEALIDGLRSEFPEQSLLELAVSYTNRGLTEDAISILGLASEVGGGAVATAWTAYLTGDASMLDASAEADPAFAFPFRPETLPILRWAAESNEAWQWRYLLGLNLWALDRDDEAASVLAALGDLPDYGPFYVARGHLLAEADGVDPGPDLRRAVELDPGSRLLSIELIRHLHDAGHWEDALAASEGARTDFPEDFNVALLHVRGLLWADRPADALAVLAETQVLPSENARDSHRLYALAHMASALDRLEVSRPAEARAYLDAALLWPESLGQGRPYDPDERLVRYLLGVAWEMEGDELAAAREFRDAGLAGAGDAPPEDPGAANLTSSDGGFFAELEMRLILRARALRGRSDPHGGRDDC